MFKAIAKGYGAALIIGIAGYLTFGGPLWAWALLIWIGGAPITLFFTQPQEDTADDTSAVVSDSRPLSWLTSGFGKTRLDGGS